MKLKIIAKSDSGGFVGIDAQSEYVVFTLDDSVDIAIGEILSSGTWDDSNGLFKTVRNLTKQEDVRICIENWACSRPVAIDLLKLLNSPTQIATLEGY